MSKVIKLPVSQTDIFGTELDELSNFPIYTRPQINLANSISQATRPKNVGQLSDLIQEYKSQHTDVNLKSWYDWYIKRHPEAIDRATQKVYSQVMKFIEALKEIDEDMVRDWVLDLVIKKSFHGLLFQEICIQKTAEYFNLPWRLANSSEESRGINGFIGTVPVQVKKDQGAYHVLMDQLPPKHSLILYKARKDGSLFVEFDSDITGMRDV